MFTDLYDQIDLTRSELLNVDENSTIEGALSGSGVKADDDNQVLITIGFRQRVNINAIIVRPYLKEVDHAPKNVKIFANTLNMSFGEAATRTPAHQVQLTPQELGEEIQVKYVKFQNVTTLTIFFEGTLGEEDVLKFGKLTISGTLAQVAKMEELKKSNQPNQ